MSSPHGIMKSTGCNYTAVHKLEVIEGLIIKRKKAIRVGRVHKNDSRAAMQLDILRAIARDYRTPPTTQKENT
jgi:hypothetical protein